MNGLLEHPQFTRPEKVNLVMFQKFFFLSGDHKKISRWKLKESLRTTLHIKDLNMLEKNTYYELEEELIIEIKDE